jgi:hypothetical protein
VICRVLHFFSTFGVQHALIETNMKRTKMKTSAALLMFALLSCAAGAGLADVRVTIDCNASGGKCPLPVPPVPPAPAAPPLPAVPPLPPDPPAPPPEPQVPDVPAAAHAACASKSPGSTLAWTLQKGETMTGVCIRDEGKMVFSLREYERKD